MSVDKNDHEKGGGEDDNRGEGNPTARAQGDVLTAKHDAQDGEKECEHKQRPKGSVEAFAKHSHKTHTEAQQEAVDTREDGKEKHLHKTSVEVVGCGLGTTAHIGKELLEGNHNGKAEEDQRILFGIGCGVTIDIEKEFITQPNTKTEQRHMHHRGSEGDEHAG